MDRTPLDRLADMAGIEARFWDIQGRIHERSPETARHLLAALGIAADTAAAIEASLIRLEEDPWREILPPAIVALEGAEIDVPVRLAANASGHQIRWAITYQDAAQASGDWHWEGASVESVGVIDGVPIELRILKLAGQPPGYHRLRISAKTEATTTIIVAPRHCYLPEDWHGHRYWGIATQLYAVRTNKDWGIGDFGSLRVLMDWSTAQGAAAVGINPLHALFPNSPEQASPYSPSSRLFVNPLYIDVADAAIVAGCSDPDAPVQTLDLVRRAEFIDYAAVAQAKSACFERLFQHFLRAGPDETGATFRAFVRRSGEQLRRFSAYQLLTEHFNGHDWRQWPEAYHNPASPAVAELERAHAGRIAFFNYLQYLCDRQLSGAVKSQQGTGTGLGLYRDLAVGVDVAGADVWAYQDVFMLEARVGAPPDPFNEVGQEWGVVPINPRRLRATGYEHFVSLLRANMRHAGALRIDHVMGLERLFVIPAGAPPSEGAYIRFPRDDMLAAIALESHQSRCVVIGEDLGTVPEGFRERMAAANVLSTRILYFECDGGRVRRPSEFPDLACVSVATHDLATLRGYWIGADITAKARLGVYKTSEDEDLARDQRARDKWALLHALVDENLLPDGLPADLRDTAFTPAIGGAIHRYLARSRSRLFMMQLDDLVHELEQANLPGSSYQYPNWRRRIHRSLEELTVDGDVLDTLAKIQAEREACA